MRPWAWISVARGRLALLLVALTLFLGACRDEGATPPALTDRPEALPTKPVRSFSPEAPRIALVIGNTQYQHLPALTNPRNDAALIGRTLQDLGFRLFEGKAHYNLSGARLTALVARYRQNLSATRAVGFVYYAGHALQVRGDNWLAPVDAVLRSEADLAARFVPVNALLGRSNNGAANLVVLDACRDNPLAEVAPGLLGGTSGAGLSRIQAPQDTLVAFSTAPGAVALDGEGQNSPYAAALATALTQPNRRVEDVFISVRNEVVGATQGFQVPWETSSLSQRLFLRAGDGAGPAAPAAFVMPTPRAGGKERQIEAFCEEGPDGRLRDGRSASVSCKTLTRQPDGRYWYRWYLRSELEARCARDTDGWAVKLETQPDGSLARADKTERYRFDGDTLHHNTNYQNTPRATRYVRSTICVLPE